MTSHLHVPRTPACRPPAGRSDACLCGIDEPLSVSASHPAPGVAVVRAVGEIDLGTAPRWARALTDACDHVAGPPRRGAPTPRLVCDLTGVGFLGASGLSVLVDLRDRTRGLGVGLRLVVATTSVRRTLALTALDRMVPVDRRLLDALEGAP